MQGFAHTEGWWRPRVSPRKEIVGDLLALDTALKR